MPGRVRDPGGREVHHPLGHHGPEAGVGQGLAHRGLKKVAVGHGGDAPPDHLRRGQEGALVNLIGIEPAALGREDKLREPLLQGEIVGQAPEPDHGSVAMGIDQAREEQGPLGVQALPGGGEVLVGPRSARLRRFCRL